MKRAAPLTSGVLSLLCVFAACITSPRRDPHARASSADATAYATHQAGLDTDSVYHVPVADSPVRGDPHAPLTMVVFVDFECPFSRKLQSKIETLQAHYGDALRVVVKHRPLPFHEHARDAARAALAAHRQGRFWAYHDALLAARRPTTDILYQLAQAQGISRPEVSAALESQRHDERLREDIELADRLGVRATPVSFVNGRPIVGNAPIETFIRIADQELARARALLATGVPEHRLYDSLLDRAYEATDAHGPRHAVRQNHAWHGGDARAVAAPRLGPEAATVTVEAFLDPHDPGSAEWVALLPDLRGAFPDDLGVVIEHLPRATGGTAHAVSRASLVLHHLGRFEEALPWLFSSSGPLEEADIRDHAASLGVEMPSYDALMSDPSVDRRLELDLERARRVGVEGTPSFLVNGRLVAGSLSLLQWKQILGQERERARRLLASGASREDLYRPLARRLARSDAPTLRQVPVTHAIDTERGPRLGSADAPVRLVAFIDFECPASRELFPILARIREQYTDQVQIIYKQLPLRMHEHAEDAARMALAAHELAAFAEIYEHLTRGPTVMGPDEVAGHAARLGIDAEALLAAMHGEDVDARLQEDSRDARMAGIARTPTLILNGRQLYGAYGERALRSVIDDELARQRTGRLPHRHASFVEAVNHPHGGTNENE